MTVDGKQLGNPFSTGSGGSRFEANIQATFVTLMPNGGYAPRLPAWPIVELKLQGAVAGYDTDDLMVFLENPVNNSIKVTATNCLPRLFKQPGMILIILGPSPREHCSCRIDLLFRLDQT